MKIVSLLTIAIALFISGCAGLAPHVNTNSTSFYVEDFKPEGSVVVIAADASVNNSLEFAAYKRKFESKLADLGYVIVQDPNQSDFIALVAYGIDDGKSSNVTTPIFGQTGGGTTYSSGTVYGSGSSASYSGTSYTMPTYGVVGGSSRAVTSYSRAIALDIVEAKSFKSGSPVKVYEGRTKSKGSCSVIVEVFDEMLDAMFNDFVGRNGRNRKLTLPGDFNC